MHFDHERIPERVVHARGAGAHGVFEAYGDARATSPAPTSSQAGATHAGVRPLLDRGRARAARPTPCATCAASPTKFYTDEGIFDLVGNNIPVFFIQDGIKFPDLIHAAKPEPDREIPQAQTAHTTFWDFVSLHPRVDPHADVGRCRTGPSRARTG